MVRGDDRMSGKILATRNLSKTKGIAVSLME